jgi:hypothetical protein
VYKNSTLLWEGQHNILPCSKHYTNELILLEEQSSLTFFTFLNNSMLNDLNCVSLECRESSLSLKNIDGTKSNIAFMP